MEIKLMRERKRKTKTKNTFEENNIGYSELGERNEVEDTK